MKNIYTYIAKDGYAARVQDTKSYDAIRFVNFSVPPVLQTHLLRHQQGHTVEMDIPPRP